MTKGTTLTKKAWGSVFLYSGLAAWAWTSGQYRLGWGLFGLGVFFAVYHNLTASRAGKRGETSPGSSDVARPIKPRFLRKEEAFKTIRGIRSILLPFIILAAPVIFVFEWIRSGAIGYGFKGVAVTVGLGLIVVFVVDVGLWILSLLDRRQAENDPDRLERQKRDREEYELALKDYAVALKNYDAAYARSVTPVVDARDALERLAANFPIAKVRDLSTVLPPMRLLLGKEELLYLAQGSFGTAGGLVAVTPTRLMSDAFGSNLAGPRIVPLSTIQRIFRDDLNSVHIVSTFEEFAFRIVGGGSWDQLREVVEEGRMRMAPGPELSTS